MDPAPENLDHLPGTPATGQQHQPQGQQPSQSQQAAQPNLSQGPQTQWEALQAAHQRLRATALQEQVVYFSLQVESSLVASQQQVQAIEAALYGALHNAWQHVQQGPLPLRYNTPVALVTHMHQKVCTVRLHIFLPTDVAGQLYRLLASNLGGVFLHIPGASRPVLAHVHLFKQASLYLFTVASDQGHYPAGAMAQFLVSQGHFFHGMQLLWLGQCDARGEQILQRYAYDGSALPPIISPQLLDPCCLVGLAVGGQQCLHPHPPVPLPPGCAPEAFCFRRVPNRAYAATSPAPSVPSPGPAGTSAPAPAGDTASQPQPQPGAPQGPLPSTGGAPPPTHQAPSPSMQAATVGQSAGPGSPSALLGQEPPAASGSAATTQPGPQAATPAEPHLRTAGPQQAAHPPSSPPPPPLPHHPSTPVCGSAPQPTTQPSPATPQPSSSRPQPPSGGPAATAARPAPKAATTASTLPLVGEWVQLRKWTGHPRLGLVATHRWVPQSKRFVPRIVLEDGNWEDVGQAQWDQLTVVQQRDIPVATLQRLGAVIAQLAAADQQQLNVFPPDSPLPNWQSTGIIFPAGFTPPQPSSTRPVRSTRATHQPPATAATATQPAAPTAGRKTTAPVGGARRLRHEKKARRASACTSTSSSEAYGVTSSLTGDQEDMYAECTLYEQCLPSFAYTRTATGPTQGRRPGR